ncbi:hypothetical protein MMC22_006647 [Lobaria immixta]|nr:hypothetical protein [Lobaria immixta]
MPSPKPGNFCVYTTVPVDLDFLVRTLDEGQFNNPPSQTQFAVCSNSFLNQPVSAIVNYHRTSPGVFNKQYFIVADRAEWLAEGIIAVNLDFDGFIDATRMLAGIAGDAIPSVSILNSEWYEILGSRLDDRMYPKDQFAVYARENITGQADGERKLLTALNTGLESRKDYSVPVCRLAPTPLATSKVPDRTDVEIDLSSVASKHAQITRDEGFDPSTFILADEVDWDQHGVLVVRVAEDGAVLDQYRKPIDVAAEVLTWFYLGLYTWEEGKAWDDKKCEIEED